MADGLLDISFHGIEKETLPLYRHKWLYRNCQEYQEHKFFTEHDFVVEKRIYDLKRKGSSDYNSAYGVLESEVDYHKYEYKDRYSSLNQNTDFYRVLGTLMSIRISCKNYSEYVMKSALRGIEEKFLHFEMLYSWFARDRWLEFVYKSMEEAHEDDVSEYDGYDEWKTLNEMRKEAFKNGHKKCSLIDFCRLYV